MYLDSGGTTSSSCFASISFIKSTFGSEGIWYPVLYGEVKSCAGRASLKKSSERELRMLSCGSR